LLRKEVKRVTGFLKDIFYDEEGQGMTEYILIVVLIAIAGILVWRAFGDRIIEMVRQSTKELEGVKVKPQKY